MIICSCILHLELPYVQSLKGRRSVTNSMKEKLKAFNLSVMDISGEYAKEADIAFVFLSPNSLKSAQYREKIEQMLERNFSEYHFEMDYEEIWIEKSKPIRLHVSLAMFRTVKVVKKNTYPCEESREEQIPWKVGRKTLFKHR